MATAMWVEVGWELERWWKGTVTNFQFGRTWKHKCMHLEITSHLNAYQLKSPAVLSSLTSENCGSFCGEKTQSKDRSTVCQKQSQWKKYDTYFWNDCSITTIHDCDEYDYESNGNYVNVVIMRWSSTCCYWWWYCCDDNGYNCDDDHEYEIKEFYLLKWCWW